MKDASDEILSWLFVTLDKQITYDGSLVPVYIGIDADQKRYYVRIGEQTTVNESAKDCTFLNYTTLIQVVTRFTKDEGSRKPMNLIGSDVLNLVCDKTGTTQNFALVVNTLDNISDTEELTDTEHIFVKQIRIRTQVQQLN